MLRVLLTPLRWLLRVMFYGCIAIVVMLVVAPFALNLPAHAERVLAALNDGELRGLRIRALPAGAGGFPPELEIRNLQVTSVAGGPAQVAMVASTVRVGINVMESISRGEPVMVAMVENPVIYANAPLNLGAISTAITQITGIATQIQLIGGEIINPATSTTVALGDNVVRVDGSNDDQVADLGGDGGANTNPNVTGGSVGSPATSGLPLTPVVGSTGTTVPGVTTPPGGGTVPGGTTPPGGGTVPGVTTPPGGGTVPGVTTPPGGGTVPGVTTPPGGGTVPGGTTPPGGGTIPGVTTPPGGGTVPGVCTCPCGF